MRTLFLLVLFIPLSLPASTYYVDSQAGQDEASGNSPKAAWKTLAKINLTKFRSGDRVLFKSGSVWTGQLVPKTANNSADGEPVIFDRFGNGPNPKIDGKGEVEDAIRLYNVQNVEVRNLEVTNHGEKPAVRRGVHIFLDNFGTARHIVIFGLYIHDVNGTNGDGNNGKDNGGIIFRTNGARVSSRFDGLRIEHNIVRAVDRSAIAADSYHARRTHWFPSVNVVIKDNYVDDIGGDGIVPWATDHALIEHNIARNCNRRAGSYNAGIWPWSTDNSLFQLNEASWTRTTLDGEGFDSDYNSRNTLFQYNYSHDNEGGFMLICTPGKRDPKENVGNTGTVIRKNISRNDKTRAFHLSGGEHTLVEDNVIYVGPNMETQMLAVTSWDGWASDALFRNNVFWVLGQTTYGHELKRNPDGTYELGPGWGPAREIVFQGNRYIGRQDNRPDDSSGKVVESQQPPKLDWQGPEFDTTQPQKFDQFLKAHRRWMIQLFERQFHEELKLGR
jgi:hypothetical protein